MNAGHRMPKLAASSVISPSRAAGSIVSSNNPNRSFALSVPPTVKGSITVRNLGPLERNSRGLRAVVGRIHDHLARAGCFI